MPLNICVIGCGWVATACHGPSLVRYAAEWPATVLLACCDLDPTRAEAFRREFGFQRSYSNYREMLSAEQPDAVCLLVSETHICPISIEILAAGIPLLMEKPPGLNLAETLRMAEAAAKHGTPHAVALNRRHTPIVQILKAEIATIAEVQRYEYEMLRHDRREPDFVVTAIHAIDALRHISGADYRQIDISYHELPEYGAGVANMAMECRMTNGASAHLYIAPMGGMNKERGQVLARGVHIDFALPVPTPADGYLRRYEDNTLKKEVSADGELYMAQGFYGENHAFFEAVRAGRRPVDDLESALQSVAVADCLRARGLRFGA